MNARFHNPKEKETSYESHDEGKSGRDPIYILFSGGV
jgi:hypothetical protein